MYSLCCNFSSKVMVEACSRRILMIKMTKRRMKFTVPLILALMNVEKNIGKL